MLCGGGGHTESVLDELPGGYTMSEMRGESYGLTTGVEHFGHEAKKKRRVLLCAPLERSARWGSFSENS